MSDRFAISHAVLVRDGAGDGRRSPRPKLTQVFNTSEACLYLRISRPTFLKLIAAGKIRAKKIGKGWRVLETELERFLLTGEMARQ